MPELQFKGKEDVSNHQLIVSHRPLVVHPENSVSAVPMHRERDGGSANGNLTRYSDSLHALKALLAVMEGSLVIVANVAMNGGSRDGGVSHQCIVGFAGEQAGSVEVKEWGQHWWGGPEHLTRI